MRKPLGCTVAVLVGVAVVGACVGDDAKTFDPRDDPKDAAPGTSVDASGDVTTTSPPGDADTPIEAGDAEPIDAGEDAFDAGPPEPPTAIGPVFTSPYGLALTSTSALVLTPAELVRCTLPGCATTTIVAEDLAVLSRLPPYPIDADEANVYWLSSLSGQTSSYLFKCPVAGCLDEIPIKFVDYQLFSVWHVELGRDGRIRFGEATTIHDCAQDGTCPNGCAGTDRPRGFSFDSPRNILVFTENTDPSGMYACSGSGPSSTQTRLEVARADVVAVQGNTAYGMAKNEIFKCNTTGCGGEGPRVITGETDLTSMAVSADGVFWTAVGASATEGVVKMCPLSGCINGVPKVIASSQAAPNNIRVRGGKVYWLNRGSGRLMRAGY